MAERKGSSRRVFRFSATGGRGRGGRSLAPKGAGAEGAVGEVITSIAALPPVGMKWAVRVGRRRVALLDQRGVEALGAVVGMVWTEALAARALGLESRRSAREFALRAMAFRARSRGELVEKMVARGAERGVAESVADELAAVGIIDDAAFARAYVRSQLSQKAAGKVLLMAKLRKKRVPQEIARRAVEEELGARGGGDQVPAAAELAARRGRTMAAGLEPFVVKRRLYALLARRGFDPDVCREATEIAMKRLGKGGKGRSGLSGAEEGGD